MNSPLVSIVMPSFNQANFIKASIRSVFDQDYQSLELLVMDGGSTDGTVACLEALQPEYGPRLRWLSEKDAGPAHAINKALKLARGEFIGWLNSDDLYSPMAVSRAVRYLTAHPDMLMVYGEGKHVDENSKALGRYPTHPLNTSIEAFQAGCFICQPTVFFRREFFERVGYLDESLKTSFDFDLWLRAYKSFPGRVGYIASVQAYSRVHADCITQRMRRLVAVEGIQLLAKHVGHPQTHWLKTYVDEMCAAYPFDDAVVDLRAEIESFVGQVNSCFEPGELEAVAAQLLGEARFQMALQGAYAAVYADGWAPPVLALRMRRVAGHASSLCVVCSHDSPVPGAILVQAVCSWGAVFEVEVQQRGEFELVFEMPQALLGKNLSVNINADVTFVPREVELGSTDTRRLAFRVKQLQWV